MIKKCFFENAKKKKNYRDNTEIISQKKLIVQKIKLSSIDYEEKIKKTSNDITCVNRKLNKLKKEVKDVDEKAHEL